MIIKPHQIKQAVSAWLVSRFKEKKRWRLSSIYKQDGIRVFYGYDVLPSFRDIASGGIVKTQDLQNIFTNTPQRPNLLYLISSALPPYAPRMAQWAKKAGAKVVLNQNGVAYPAWHGEGWIETNRFMREVLRQADYVLYQSHFCKLGADRYLEHRSDACEILYNPVDTIYFRPSSSPPLFPARLLLAGSHHHFYRVQTAVDTVMRLKDSGLNVKMEIAGRCCWGADSLRAEEQLKQYIETRSLSAEITVSGPYTQKQAPLLFQRAHILLHTKYNDPCPRLVVEAMASGLPVVYSASGGTLELVGGEAGVGVPAPLDWEKDHPPSAELLADATKKVLDDYSRYSSAARKRAVVMFDVKPWIRRHQEIFSRLIKGEKIEAE